MNQQKSQTLNFNIYNNKLFENGTGLFEIKLKDNFNSFAKDKGFGFAEFCSSIIHEDIFVPHKVTNKILKKMPIFPSSLWAEVSSREEGKTQKYRIKSLWILLDDVINNTKNIHIKESATYIQQFQVLKSRYHDHKVNTVVKNSREVDVYDNFLSPQKQSQLNLRLSNIGNPETEWRKHNILAYTYAEYYIEYWAKAHDLSVLDYNEKNQRAPQDYNIDGKDIDVKSVIGVGRRKGTQYSSISEKGEVLIGVNTYTAKLNDSLMKISIDGVFDPKQYENINLTLNYLKLNSSPNVCYFSSLHDYFFPSISEQLTPQAINYALIVHAEHTKTLPLLLKNIDSKNHENLLTKLITPSNQQLIPIVIELLSKNKLVLFYHFLADYIIEKTVQKHIIDIQNIRQLLECISPCSTRVNTFIGDLLKVNETLKKVRCHWHPAETIVEMGIDVYYSDTSTVPTLKAVCSCNPNLKTTFFTYSWKTNETLAYQGDGDICDHHLCGCLLHQYKDYELNSILLGKSSCAKYGRDAYNRWIENKQYPY